MASRTARMSRVRGSVLYFFLFASYGLVGPFMPLIWRSKGLSEHQVGLLGAIRPIASFFVTPYICAFADKYNLQQQVLYASLLLYSITRPCILAAASFFAVGAVEASCSVSKSPLGSLIDSAVRHIYGSDGYGYQRLWGAVGFGVASLVGGYVSDSAWGGYEGVMAVFGGIMAVTLVASMGVSVRKDGVEEGQEQEASVKRLLNGDGSHIDNAASEIELGGKMVNGDEIHVSYSSSATDAVVDSDDRHPGDKSTGSSSQGGSVGEIGDGSDEGDTASEGGGDSEEGVVCGGNDAFGVEGEEEGGVLSVVRMMLGNAQNATFFAAVGLSGMGAGVIDTFLFIRLEELGGSHTLCGLARLIMCIAEVPFFYLSGPLIRLLGVRGVIALTQSAYVVRFIYYSVLRNPFWVLPAEVLHGLTFAAMWAATTEYAHEIAPAHLRTTIQGVVSGLHWGLGFGLGAMLGGVMYAGLGPVQCFRLSAILPSTSLLLLAMPTARSWYGDVRGWKWRAATVETGMVPIKKGDEGGSYELVDAGYRDSNSSNRVSTDNSKRNTDGSGIGDQGTRQEDYFNQAESIPTSPVALASTATPNTPEHRESRVL